MSKTTRYTGGCHCGAVRFAVEVEETVARACNCSICEMGGYLHVIVDRDRFELLSGREALSTYTFNTGVAQHTFCTRCGIKAFYTPRSHPEGISANLRCFDGDVAARFRVESFDGKNWEAAVHSIQ